MEYPSVSCILGEGKKGGAQVSCGGNKPGFHKREGDGGSNQCPMWLLPAVA